MKILHPILAFTLLGVLLVTGACATEPQTQPTHDVPRLSPQEAITIAQFHSMNSPQDAWERCAGDIARRGGTGGWQAEYSGNGKWSVTLLFLHKNEKDTLMVCHWTVFEVNVSAMYMGAHKAG